MIKHLELTNFRNHSDHKIDFSDINIFIGSNGIGKTNIVEAVWLLADGRSWRTGHDTETVKWGEEFTRIKGDIEKDSRKEEIELIIKAKESSGAVGKVLKINGVKRRVLELLGEMPAVLFSPETILLIDGAPSLRRKFLDIMLSQIEKIYAVDLSQYQKVIKERNKLLFNIKIRKSKEEELEFWDEKMVSLGGKIISKRKKAIEYFNKNISDIYQDISGKNEEIKLCYKETAEEDRFEEYLIAARQREIEQAATIIGPHRDDIEILLNGKDISTFGSRGEYRSAVLALKIMELRYLEEHQEQKPILLLDDIFSELDKDRRMHLAKIVSNQQTIITTTDLDHIEKGLREKAKIVELDDKK